MSESVIVTFKSSHGLLSTVGYGDTKDAALADACTEAERRTGRHVVAVSVSTPHTILWDLRGTALARPWS